MHSHYEQPTLYTDMKLPTSWAEVTIRQYHQVISIFNVHKDDWVETQIKLLALFSGQTVKEVEQINYMELKKEAAKLAFLSEPIPEGKLASTFKLKGKVYKAALLHSDMKGGQFMDFSHAGKGCTPEELPYHMHELIASMCQTRIDNPKVNWFKRVTATWKYEGYDKTAEDFLDMPMTLAYPYYVFFCNVLTNLQEPILEYSQKQIKKTLKKAKELMESV